MSMMLRNLLYAVEGQFNTLPPESTIVKGFSLLVETEAPAGTPSQCILWTDVNSVLKWSFYTDPLVYPDFPKDEDIPETN